MQVFLVTAHIVSNLNLCHPNVIGNITPPDHVIEHSWTNDSYCLPRCGANPNFIASNVTIGLLGCLPKDNCSTVQNTYILRWSRNCIITIGEQRTFINIQQLEEYILMNIQQLEQCTLMNIQQLEQCTLMNIQQLEECTMMNIQKLLLQKKKKKTVVVIKCGQPTQFQTIFRSRKWQRLAHG